MFCLTEADYIVFDSIGKLSYKLLGFRMETCGSWFVMTIYLLVFLNEWENDREKERKETEREKEQKEKQKEKECGSLSAPLSLSTLMLDSNQHPALTGPPP